MSESKDSITLDDQHRTEWDRVWSEMEARNVKKVFNLDAGAFFQYDFGRPLSAIVSKIPIQYIERMYFPTQTCPLCMKPANDLQDRYAANLSIEFERINGLGVSVWVHSKCYDELPLSDKPSPVPW